MGSSFRTRSGEGATGLTWLAVRGDDPLKIIQRAGHSDFATTQGYIRTAEAVRDGFGEVFLPLPPLTPDGANGPAKGPIEVYLSRRIVEALP